MPTFTFECGSESELAALRRAALFVSEMHRLALSASGGGVLSAVEGLAEREGRAVLLGTLESAVAGRVDAAEEKGAALASARAPAASA